VAPPAKHGCETALGTRTLKHCAVEAAQLPKLGVKAMDHTSCLKAKQFKTFSLYVKYK
jgi:hypothetical protein